MFCYRVNKKCYMSFSLLVEMLSSHGWHLANSLCYRLWPSISFNNVRLYWLIARFCFEHMQHPDRTLHLILFFTSGPIKVSVFIQLVSTLC